MTATTTIALPPKDPFPPPRAADTFAAPCSNVGAPPPQSSFPAPSSEGAQPAALVLGTVPVPAADLGALHQPAFAGSLRRLPGEISTRPPQVKENKAVRDHSLSLCAKAH